jgi:hypothetical protein
MPLQQRMYLHANDQRATLEPHSRVVRRRAHGAVRRDAERCPRANGTCSTGPALTIAIVTPRDPPLASALATFELRPHSGVGRRASGSCALQRTREAATRHGLTARLRSQERNSDRRSGRIWRPAGTIGSGRW